MANGINKQVIKTSSGGGGGSGNVVGPTSSSDNAIVRFDGTTGKIIQNSTNTISDVGGVTINSSSGVALHVNANGGGTDVLFTNTVDDIMFNIEATPATKAPRRVMLPELTTNMAAAAAAGSLLTQPSYNVTFINPIYVNPGERIALVGNKTITTAITSGVLSFMYQFDYSWE